MTDFELLLAVQGLDIRATQLAHRRATLPERAALVEAESAMASVEARTAAAEAEQHTLLREQKRLEDEIAGLKDRATSVDRRMYGGTVSNIRELQSMGDEVKSLNRHITALEDEELEIMEQLEPIDAQLAALSEERATCAARIEEIRQRLTVAEAEIDSEAEQVTRDRADRASGVPDAVLSEYDQIRRRSQGIGVARLVNGQCGGCHLKLPAVELDRIRRQPPDALVHCEECERLLVR